MHGRRASTIQINCCLRLLSAVAVCGCCQCPCAIAAAHRTGACLVFPANVWVYGPGRVGDFIDESRVASPTSRRGALREEMEREIRTAGIRYAIVRLPEFYGPGVVSLTARVFRAALANRRALWPGPLDATLELVYIPDAAQALVTVAAKSENAIFHLTGTRTTPYTFAQSVYRAAGRDLRVSAVPPWMLASAGLFSATARGAADISHLWTSPILLDSTKYTAHFGAVPRTPLADAIGTTLAWRRAHAELRLQA